MQSQEQSEIKNHISINPKTNNFRHGQYKITCPSCQKDRKKHRNDTPLSVNINAETIVYHCHHCGINGAMPRLKGANMSVIKEPQIKKITPPKNDTDGKSAQWLKLSLIHI